MRIHFSLLLRHSKWYTSRTVATIQKYFDEAHQAVLPQLYLYHRVFAGIYSADQHFYKFNAPDWNGDSLLIDDKLLRLEDIHDFVEKEIEDVSDEMDRLLFHRFRLSETRDIHDDPSSRTGSWGFTDHAQNQWADHGTVVRYILETPSLFAQFAYRNAKGHVIWKPSPCLSYSKAIFDLMMRIFVLVILTFGAPGRGTELLSWLFRNISAGSIRNVFLLFGHLILRGSYNKTASATHADKPIVRIPLPAVGALLVRMLAFLRPIYCEFQRVFHPYLYKDAQHLLLPGFDRPLETRDISAALSDTFGKNWNIRMSLGRYRQAISFIFECNSELFCIELHTSGAAKQLGHTDQMNRTNYSGDERLPSGLNDSQFRENAVTSAKFHRLLGFDLQLLVDIQAGRGRQRMIMADIESIAHGHSSVIPGAASTMSHSFSAIDIAEQLHRLLRPSIREDIAQGVATMAYTFNPRPLPNEVVSSNQGPVHITLIKAFRTFLHILGVQESLATFSNSAQRDALVVMAQKQSHLVYVSGTGTYQQIYHIHSRSPSIRYRQISTGHVLIVVSG